MPSYNHHYSHLLNVIPPSDVALLRRAERSSWEDIEPSRASDPRTRMALDRIVSEKFHREEAANDYV